jgi:hypothetical protein
MKRTLLALALVTAAGTAGAQTATTPSVGGTTVTPPSVGGGAVTTPPVTGGTVQAPSTANAPAMPNAQGSANAVKKIEADGYKNVQGLQRNPDGSWSGKALRGGAMVDVHVDARGNGVTR